MTRLPLRDAWVLVTGASSEVGQEIARCFASTGANLVLTARRSDRLWDLQYELRHRHRVESIPIVADLSRKDSIEKIRERVDAAGKKIEVLVHNAAIGHRGEFHEMEADGARKVIEVNVTAPVELTRLFLPEMVSRGSGGVLTLASPAALRPVRSMGLHAASQSFLRSFMEALHQEVLPLGIRVSWVCPGSLPPDKVAQFAMISLIRNRPVAIRGFANRLHAFLHRLGSKGRVPRE